MSPRNKISGKSVANFLASYDTSHEDSATHSRGEFIKAFPRATLSRLTRRRYCIGFQSPSFCTFVEVTTRPWGNIQGATADKFGIYYGKTKRDPKKRYRFARRFGDTDAAAFIAVRTAIVDLVTLGRETNLDFAAIDANPLSQMFKAKILSLYYPDRFINVCSGDHLRKLGRICSMPMGKPVSCYQHLLIREKYNNRLTQGWSNPRFMAFLYAQLLRKPRTSSAPIGRQKAPKHRVVDIEALLAARNRIGRRAEEFARKWEARRLEGMGYVSGSSLISDRRSQPSYGYDFESSPAIAERRYIEVKAISDRGENVRFFLSENERRVSLASECAKFYFFYLVRFKHGKPIKLDAVPSRKMHKYVRLDAASYEALLRLDL